jgi:hypothetical protein
MSFLCIVYLSSPYTLYFLLGGLYIYVSIIFIHDAFILAFRRYEHGPSVTFCCIRNSAWSWQIGLARSDHISTMTARCSHISQLRHPRPPTKIDSK